MPRTKRVDAYNLIAARLRILERAVASSESEELASDADDAEARARLEIARPVVKACVRQARTSQQVELPGLEVRRRNTAMHHYADTAEAIRGADSAGLNRMQRRGRGLGTSPGQAQPLNAAAPVFVPHVDRVLGALLGPT